MRGNMSRDVGLLQDDYSPQLRVAEDAELAGSC